MSYQNKGDKGDKGDKGEPGSNFPYENCPICPDLTRKIDRIYIALLGADGMGLTDGIVHALTQLQKNQRVESSWINVLKPLLIGIISAGLAAAVTYLLIIH